jgi:hypothetical protein
MRGFLWMVVGIILILGAALYVQDPSMLMSSEGIIMLASFVFALLILWFSKLSYARRHHGPRYQAPDEMSGRCSACARPAQLKHSKQGWLCTRCAHRSDAQAA